LNSLGLVYQAQGKFELAEPLLVESFEGRSQALGAEHPVTLRVMNNLADLYRMQGKQAEAVSMLRKILDARRRALGPDHPSTGEVCAALGELKLEQHNYAEAEALLRDALRIGEKARPDSWRTYQTRSLLGVSLAGLGRFAEAEPLEVAAYRGLLDRQSSIPAEQRYIVKQAQERMAQLYEVSRTPQQAAK
jgi:Flp pilus assembly protein TadD